MGLEFIDDREKVMKGADGRRRGSIGVAGEPAGRSQDESRSYEFERDVATVEIGR